MPSAYYDQRSVAEYPTSTNSTTGYGSTYGSVANQAVHYPPAYESGYTTATNSSSMNTANSGQQQYSYTPSYPSYETSENIDSEEMSDQRR